MACFGCTTLPDGDLAVVVEFCNQGSLLDALYGGNVRDLSPTQRLRIAQGAAAGVAHLHHQSVVHRDLAARNVLLNTDELVPKVCDFGMARDIDESLYEQQTKQDIGVCLGERGLFALVYDVDLLTNKTTLAHSLSNGWHRKIFVIRFIRVQVMFFRLAYCCTRFGRAKCRGKVSSESLCVCALGRLSV